MKVTQGQVISRGLMNRCPNCGGAHLFKDGTLFQLNKECPACRLRFEKDEGFFLGAMALNYGVTVIVFLTPVALAWYAGWLGVRLAVGLAIGLALAMPLVLYRASRSWQLMLYYFFFPQHLPANRRILAQGEDENV